MDVNVRRALVLGAFVFVICASDLPGPAALSVAMLAADDVITLTINPADDPDGARAELIGAIHAANLDPDRTTVHLVCGTYTLTTRLTTLYGFSGLPVITSDVVIEGHGAVIERLPAGQPFRILTVAGAGDLDVATNAVLPAGRLTLRSVTIRGGLARGGDGGRGEDGGGGGGAGLGGGVYNRGTVVVEQSAFLENTAQGGSGANGGVGGSGEGGGGGGMGGAGGSSIISTDGGGGGGGFGGAGNTGADETQNAGNGGGGGGGTINNGAQGVGDSGGAGGVQNGGAGGGNGNTGADGGYGGGGGGGGADGNGGRGGLGGGGGGAGDNVAGGDGGYGGGGGAGSEAEGGDGGFGGGGGGSGEDSLGGFPGYGGGEGGDSPSSSDGGGGGGGLGAGGAIFNDGGTLVIANSTFSGNRAIGGSGGSGGALGESGAGLGGAVFARNGSVTANHATLTLNAAADGGGAMFILGDGGPVFMTGSNTVQRPGALTDVSYSVRNTILANSAGPSDVAIDTWQAGTATAAVNAYNLVEVNGFDPAGSDAGDLPGVILTTDPGLQDLAVLVACAADTCRAPVHPLSVTSPAVNAAQSPTTVAVDQTGTDRPQGSGPDLGAYELCCTLAANAWPATLPGGLLDLAYATQTFTVTGAIGTVTWSVSGTLPPGLSLAPLTGASTNLSGLPTDVGTYVFELTATDQLGCSVKKSYTVVVGAARLSLSKTPSTYTYSQAGQAILYTLTATNTGTVPLTGVLITDPLLPGLACTPTQPAALAPGGTLACTGTHVVTPADLIAGQITNTAIVSGLASDTILLRAPDVAAPEAIVTVTAQATVMVFGIAPGVGSTRLALTACTIELQQDWTPRYTKLQFEVWNEDEVKFTGAFECADSWHETDFGPSLDAAQQNFTIGVIGTYGARYRVQAVTSTQCPGARATGLLGVQSMTIGAGQKSIGTTLVGAGKFTGSIRWDPAGAVPEGAIR